MFKEYLLPSSPDYKVLKIDFFKKFPGTTNLATDGGWDWKAENCSIYVFYGLQAVRACPGSRLVKQNGPPRSSSFTCVGKE
jgi:hypothetical protein